MLGRVWIVHYVDDEWNPEPIIGAYNTLEDAQRAVAITAGRPLEWRLQGEGFKAEVGYLAGNYSIELFEIGKMPNVARVYITPTTEVP